MIGRFRQALAAGRRAVAETGPSDPAPQPVLALLALDETDPGFEGMRDRHLAAARAIGARALFVLSPHSARDFAGAGLLCEFLPLPEDLARTTGDGPGAIALYRQNRLRLILDKWGVQECRWTGDSAADLVAAWSPERDPRLRPIRFLPAP
jgi:hypothetical protein